jgi:NitT/TauT family transport system substrate-binding protein
MFGLSRITIAFAGAMLAWGGSHAIAQDKIDELKVVSAQRGLWTTTLIHFGNEEGIFEKHGLKLDLQWADGGANTQQAIVSGAADVAIATGTLGAITAWVRGAPVEIIANDFVGGSDLFWYVRGDSDIKSVADLGGRSVAFSRPGASSHLMAQGVLQEAGITADLVPTGAPAATLTAVMSGQVDVGWTAPPTVDAQLEKGAIRVLFSGNDAPGIAEQSVRVHIANRAFLEANEELVKRFLVAMGETIDWAYDTDGAIQMWAEMHSVDLETARAARDRGYPRDALALAPVRGVAESIEQAIETRRLESAVPAEQIEKMLEWSNRLNP